jgi:hypothetical protein
MSDDKEPESPPSSAPVPAAHVDHPGSVWSLIDRVDVRVLPMCPRCVHEVQGSPEYWIEKLEAIRRPTLTLIRGDGESPESFRRDHLRPVEADDDSE